jgi:hypothetical protein
MSFSTFQLLDSHLLVGFRFYMLLKKPQIYSFRVIVFLATYLVLLLRKLVSVLLYNLKKKQFHFFWSSTPLGRGRIYLDIRVTSKELCIDGLSMRNLYSLYNTYIFRVVYRVRLVLRLVLRFEFCLDLRRLGLDFRLDLRFDLREPPRAC